MANQGAFSADIISSTSLNLDYKYELIQEIQVLLTELKMKFDVYARLTKGDAIEGVIPKPELSLRIALIIKCFVKSKSVGNPNISGRAIRSKYFEIHGVRIAIAIGEMDRVDRGKGVLEGEAIYEAGREIESHHTSNKQRVVIKKTIFFYSKNKYWKDEFDVIFALLDVLISKITQRQSEVVMHRLLGRSEVEIAEQLYISQSAVNQNSTSAGWNAIEKAITRFEQIIKA